MTIDFPTTLINPNGSHCVHVYAAFYSIKVMAKERISWISCLESSSSLWTAARVLDDIFKGQLSRW